LLAKSCILTRRNGIYFTAGFSGAEYITMGRIPIEGPLGESMVDNVHLNYNFKAHEDSVESYWELDSELVDTTKREGNRKH